MKSFLIALLLLLSSFSQKAFSESDSLSQLGKQMVNSASSAAGASEDLLALDFLQGKFRASTVTTKDPTTQITTTKLVLPAWYPLTYPLPEEMSQKPRIWVFQRPAATSSVPLLIPRWEIFKEKKAGECVPVTPHKFLYEKTDTAPTDCPNDITLYRPDITGLSGAQRLNFTTGQIETDPEKDSLQTAFIGVYDMNSLTSAQKSSMLTDPNFSLPRTVGNIEAKKVVFNRYIVDPLNTHRLASMEVQVGNTLAIIPFQKSFPPAPKCQIQVITPQPVPRLGTVQFNLLVDSVARSGEIRLSNGKSDAILNSELINIQTPNIGTFVKVNTTPLELTLTQADSTDPTVRRTMTSDKRYWNWTITGSVTGINSGSILCEKQLQVFDPPPDCSLTVGKTELLQGESTMANLNCTGGGPVNSAHIRTYRVPSVNSLDLSTQEKIKAFVESAAYPVISEQYSSDTFRTSKTHSYQHTKTRLIVGELIVSEVTGIGGTTYDFVPLGDVCPYNNTAFVRDEMPRLNGQYFNWWIVPDYKGNGGVYGSVVIPSVKFSMGSYRYSPQFLATKYDNTATRMETFYLWAQPAWKYHYMLGTCVGEDGSWGGCYMGGAGVEQCNADNLCMMTAQMDDNNYSSGTEQQDIKWGGHFFWVEIGRANGGTGGKYDSQCRVVNAKFREGGCFSQDTSLLMADGGQRKISDIAEGDFVFNPHYKMGVKVKKVVKGPEKKSLFEVVLGKSKIKVTEDHPFLTQRGWVQAMSLKNDDELLGEGLGKKVTRVRKLKYLGPQDVWNVELDTDEPYGKVIIANGIPTGDLGTQLEIKKSLKRLP